MEVQLSFVPIFLTVMYDRYIPIQSRIVYASWQFPRTQGSQGSWDTCAVQHELR